MNHHTAQKRQTSATPISADLCRKRKSANGNNPVGVAVADLSGAPAPAAQKNRPPAGPNLGRGTGKADHLGDSPATGEKASFPLPQFTATDDALDAESASQDTAAQVLKIDRRSVRLLIEQFDIAPTGKRRGFPVYRLADLREALALHRDPHPTPAQATTALAELAFNLPARLAHAGIAPRAL